MNNDKISVLMGMYNCENTLSQAIKSIQRQTYSNWELILCDDGSIDNTYQIAKSFAENDNRIILLKNKDNCGLNITLNKCLKKATGKYIARMDADDDCDPKRFEKQINFLKSQNKYAIVSSAMTFFDENGKWGRNYVKEYPLPEDVVSGSPICHAPAMMRKECLDEVQGYTEDKHMLRVEDVNLWIKLYVAGYRCYNIQEPLYYMRNDKNALNRRKFKYRINSTYVRLQGCRMLHMKPRFYIKSFTPIIIGLIPSQIRYFIKRKLN